MYVRYGQKPLLLYLWHITMTAPKEIIEEFYDPRPHMDKALYENERKKAIRFNVILSAIGIISTLLIFVTPADFFQTSSKTGHSNGFFFLLFGPACLYLGVDALLNLRWNVDCTDRKALLKVWPELKQYQKDVINFANYNVSIWRVCKSIIVCLLLEIPVIILIKAFV